MQSKLVHNEEDLGPLQHLRQSISWQWLTTLVAIVGFYKSLYEHLYVLEKLVVVQNYVQGCHSFHALKTEEI